MAVTTRFPGDTQSAGGAGPGLSLAEVVNEIAAGLAKPVTNGAWLTVANRGKLEQFRRNYTEAAPDVQSRALNNWPRDSGDEDFDEAIRGWAMWLADPANGPMPNWTRGLAAADLPPIASEDDVKALAAELERRGARFLVDKQARSHPLLPALLLLSAACLIVVIYVSPLRDQIGISG